MPTTSSPRRGRWRSPAGPPVQHPERLGLGGDGDGQVDAQHVGLGRGTPDLGLQAGEDPVGQTGEQDGEQVGRSSTTASTAAVTGMPTPPCGASPSPGCTATPRTKDYLATRVRDGKSKTEAIRRLMHYIARAFAALPLPR